jgi:transcriptional regulator with XRE-family HTH domain
VGRVSGKADDGKVLAAVGSAIRDRRRALGLSQEALADAARIDRSHMGKIERGERNVTILNLVRIATALEQRLSDILIAAAV